MTEDLCVDKWVPAFGPVRVCGHHSYVVIIRRNGYVTIYVVNNGNGLDVSLWRIVKARGVAFDYERGTVTVTTGESRLRLRNPLVVVEGRSGWEEVMV